MRVMFIDFFGGSNGTRREWVGQQFIGDDIESFFPSGLLEAVWGVRNFCPDAIVLDITPAWRCWDSLVSLLRKCSPEAEWFLLHGERLTMITEGRAFDGTGEGRQSGFSANSPVSFPLFSGART